MRARRTVEGHRPGLEVPLVPQFYDGPCGLLAVMQALLLRRWLPGTKKRNLDRDITNSTNEMICRAGGRTGDSKLPTRPSAAELLEALVLARTAPLVRADMRGSGAPVAACTAPCLVYTDGKHTNGLCESAVVTLALAGKACNSFALPPPQPVDVGVLSTDVIVHPDWQTPTSLASSLRQVPPESKELARSRVSIFALCAVKASMS